MQLFWLSNIFVIIGTLYNKIIELLILLKNMVILL